MKNEFWSPLRLKGAIGAAFNIAFAILCTLDFVNLKFKHVNYECILIY